MAIFKRISAVITAINKFFVALAAGGLFIMVVLIVYGTVARYLFRSPALWAIELPSYVLAWSTALALAYTQSVKGHIAVSIVVEFLSAANKAKLASYIFPVYFAVAFLAACACIRLAWLSLIEWRVSDVLKFPLFLPHLFIAVGFSFLVLEVGVQLVQAMKDRKIQN